MILRLILKRFIAALPVLIGVVVFTFILMRMLPGDPAVYLASVPGMGEEQIAAIRTSLGLDRPLPEQLFNYVIELARGDLGNSIVTGQPVTADLARRLPASLELTFVALIMTLVTAIPLGILAALYENSVIDSFVRVISAFGGAVPAFVTGLLLILVFYFYLGVSPDPTGRMDVFILPPPTITGFLLIDSAIDLNWEAFSSAFAQLLLPAVTMALFALAPIARITRASMIEVLGSEFIRTARALGLPRHTVVLTYALRNAMIPVLTMLGLIVSILLGSNVIVEKVFAWPGIGLYALDGVLASDYAPVQGFILVMAITFVSINLLIDTVHALVDPRVRSA